MTPLVTPRSTIMLSFVEQDIPSSMGGSLVRHRYIFVKLLQQYRGDTEMSAALLLHTLLLLNTTALPWKRVKTDKNGGLIDADDNQTPLYPRYPYTSGTKSVTPTYQKRSTENEPRIPLFLGGSEKNVQVTRASQICTTYTLKASLLDAFTRISFSIPPDRHPQEPPFTSPPAARQRNLSSGYRHAARQHRHARVVC